MEELRLVRAELLDVKAMLSKLVDTAPMEDDIQISDKSDIEKSGGKKKAGRGVNVNINVVRDDIVRIAREER